MYVYRPTRVYLRVTFNTVCLGWCNREEIVRLVQLLAAELLDASDSSGPPWISFTSFASYVCHSRQSHKHYTWIAITAPCMSFDTRPNIYTERKKKRLADDVFLSHFPSAERLENFMNEVVYWCPPWGEVKAKSVIFTSTLHLKKNKMVAIGCDQPACCRRLLIISILAHVPLWVVGRLTCRSMGRWSFHPHMWSVYHILPTNLGPIICFDCHYSHSQLECTWSFIRRWKWQFSGADAKDGNKCLRRTDAGKTGDRLLLRTLSTIEAVKGIDRTRDTRKCCCDHVIPHFVFHISRSN